MKISKNNVVQMHYKLTNKEGRLLDESDDQPFAYLHGHGQIVPGLESQLEGKSKGDSLNVVVAPHDAYGEYSEDLLVSVEKSQLAEIPNLSVGMEVQGESPEGTNIFTVVEIKDDQVTLDGNHPLAGETLTFDVNIVSIREATEEELAHGHAHGDGGVAH